MLAGVSGRGTSNVAIEIGRLCVDAASDVPPMVGSGTR